MSEDQSTPETDGASAKKKVPTWVWIVAGVLVFGLILQSCGGDDGSSSDSGPSQSEEIVSDPPGKSEEPELVGDLDGACFITSGYLDAASETSSALAEMSSSTNSAVNIGTEQALRAVSIEFRAVYGPRFTDLGMLWLSLPSCGDGEIDNLVLEMALTLSELGFLLSNYEYPDMVALENAALLMGDLGSIATLITSRFADG